MRPDRDSTVHSRVSLDKDRGKAPEAVAWLSATPRLTPWTKKYIHKQLGRHQLVKLKTS